MIRREHGFATVRPAGRRRLYAVDAGPLEEVDRWLGDASGGADEIEVRLSPGAADGTATLELQHATTLDAHEIGGQSHDAIFCMGGGCYPRLRALDRHLRGALPDDYDSAAFHLDPEMLPTIERGSAAMAALLAADATD